MPVSSISSRVVIRGACAKSWSCCRTRPGRPAESNLRTVLDRFAPQAEYLLADLPTALRRTLMLWSAARDIDTAASADIGLEDWSAQPTANALVNGLYQINATNPVGGASGGIYFQREPDIPDGAPFNKAIPIMQLHPDGTSAEVGLSSRSGRPPAGPESPR